VVRADQRGAVDAEAGSQSQTLRLKLARPLSPSAQLYLQAGPWREERENGTRLTQHSSRAEYLGGRATLKTAAGGHWAFSGFFQDQGFDSFFSSVAADRSAETLSLDQREVQAKAAGASVEWSRPVGAAHLLAAGVVAAGSRARATSTSALPRGSSPEGAGPAGPSRPWACICRRSSSPIPAGSLP
jgi:hypothetical protein